MDDQAVGQRAEFGATLSELRQGRGWSQERLGKELARKARKELGRRDVLPIARQTVRRWECGLCFPDALHGYLLCRVFDKDPEDFCLHRIVTPEVMARYDECSSKVGQVLAAITEGPGDDPLGVDWERLGFLLGAMRPVDAMAVEDQWALTHRILEDRARVRGRSLLEPMVAHIVRLRQLRSRTGEDRIHRELTIMLCETLIGAGTMWTGLTDFGMAVAAYREAAARADEIGEEWLRTTALMSQAQLSGIHAIAPWTPAARLALIEETHGGAVGAAPQVRVWFQATRAQMHALLGQQAEAGRALELANRAQALVPPGSGFYFALIHPVYLPIQEASVTLLAGRPREAAILFRRVAEGVDAEVKQIRTWVTVYLADAQAAAGDIERAAPTLEEARRLARQIDCPLLEHSVERIAVREPWAAGLVSRPLRHQLDTNE